MPIGFRNLSGDLQAAVGSIYPDIGQIYYLVDSNYRTAVQGWSRADHTGPFDLWAERNPGYVFRTGDYATDAAAIQAAVDEMVDYRGDTLYWTPGAYAPAAVITQNVHDSRWVGSPVSHPVSARATVTAGIAACINVAAINRFEMAFMVWMPLTASHIFAVDTAAAYLHFHDFKYSTIGIAANVATQFMLAAGTMNNSVFERFYLLTDAGQGPMFELDGDAVGLIFKNFEHMHTVGTLACSLLDDDGAASGCITVGPGFGQIGGAAGVVTTLVDLINKTNASTQITVNQFRGSVGYATTTTLVTSAGAVNDVDIVDSWIATVEGGAGRAAYVGAA